MPPHLKQIWPLLVVQDIDRSIEFYRDRLGFTLAGRAEAAGRVFWCRLERDGASLMLQQAEAEDGSAEGRGRGVSLYFVCDDVEKIYGELTARGLDMDRPSLEPYGMKQLVVPEPDGYHICFESPTEEWSG